MNNEIRNELLTLLNMEKNGEEDRKFYLQLLLERFEYDIERKEEELKRKQAELKENKEVLEHVRKELGIKSNLTGTKKYEE